MKSILYYAYHYGCDEIDFKKLKNVEYKYTIVDNSINYYLTIDNKDYIVGKILKGINLGMDSLSLEKMVNSSVEENIIVSESSKENKKISIIDTNLDYKSLAILICILKKKNKFNDTKITIKDFISDFDFNNYYLFLNCINEVIENKLVKVRK